MEDIIMKSFFLTLVCFLSLNTNALIINDSRTDVLNLLKTFELLDIPVSVPNLINSDLAYNNSNNKVSPGELVLLTHEGIDSSNFTCLVKSSGTNRWISQNEYRKKFSLPSELCVNGVKECLITIIDLTLDRETNKALMAISNDVPPGTGFRCLSYSESFEGLIID
jgi:hypothetical protein